uniref:Uncharacterized protein n=1 Tax=Arundo donax TaxID=35708 RepID=A0A0A8Z3B3_ARUDO
MSSFQMGHYLILFMARTGHCISHSALS